MYEERVMEETAPDYKKSCKEWQEKIHGVERFLLWLSKTDMFALQFCTHGTRMILTSMGMSVLITGILAYVSSFFAVESTFFRGEISFPTIMIPLSFSLIYAAGIMFFDRELVSTVGNKVVVGVLRGLFAILIGFVISFPFEIKLQQQAIDEQITRTAEEMNSPKIKIVNEYREKILKAKDAELQPLSQSIQTLENSIQTLTEAHDKECLNPDRKGCGPIADSIKVSRDGQITRLAQLKEEFARKTSSINADLEGRYREEKVIVDTLSKEIERAKGSHDLLTQAMALHELTNQNQMASIMSWALRLFFIMFELFPMLAKLSMPYTEYHAYLDARRTINVSKIIALTNYKDQQIRKDPGNMDLYKTEITDIIAEAMEDNQADLLKHVVSKTTRGEGVS